MTVTLNPSCHAQLLLGIQNDMDAILGSGVVTAVRLFSRDSVASIQEMLDVKKTFATLVRSSTYGKGLLQHLPSRIAYQAIEEAVGQAQATIEKLNFGPQMRPVLEGITYWRIIENQVGGPHHIGKLLTRVMEDIDGEYSDNGMNPLPRTVEVIPLGLLYDEPGVMAVLLLE